MIGPREHAFLGYKQDSESLIWVYYSRRRLELKHVHEYVTFGGVPQMKVPVPACQFSFCSAGTRQPSRHDGSRSFHFRPQYHPHQLQ